MNIVQAEIVANMSDLEFYSSDEEEAEFIPNFLPQLPPLIAQNNGK